MESKNTSKQVATTNTEPLDDQLILQLCKEAWRIFHKTGMWKLVLKILIEASILHRHSGLIHRAQSEIWTQACLMLSSAEYLTRAREAAKQAVCRSPNSIGFSHFYLTTLLSHDINEALEEGNRGLAIKNPIDPATEDFTDKDRDFKTAVERIDYVQRCIRDTVKECTEFLGNNPDLSKLVELRVRLAAQNTLAPPKVPVKQIYDYPRWRMPQMVNVPTDKEVLESEVFVKLSCKEALLIFHTEGSDLPLKIIQEVQHHNKNSALLHCAQGEICYQVYSGKDKALENCKYEYLLKAREHLKAAVCLSPNSIEFAWTYVKVLFVLTCYEDVIEVGEKAFAVVHPIDPAEQYVFYVKKDLPTSQERINLKWQLIQASVEVCRLLRENPDDSEEVKLEFQQMLLDKQINIWDQANWKLVNVQLILDYPYQHHRLSDEVRRQRIAALVALGKIIQSCREDSVENPESEKLMGYWNSLSVDGKRKLLNLNTDELFAHFSSRSTKKILSEAFNFYKANKSWTFRGCFCCDKKYANDEDHLAHTIKEHVGTLSPQQDSYLPRELSGGWDSVVKKYLWPGYDASAALRILEDKLELLTYFEEDFKVDVDRMQSAIGYLLTENCPKSNNTHTFALENVQTVLKSLLENDFLAAEHLKMVTDYSMDRLEVLVPDSRPWELGLHQTHLCICLLGLSELIEILTFLEEITKISDATETSKIPKAESPPTDIKEEIDLDEKSLCLLLNEQFISSSDDSATTNEDAVFKSIFQGYSSEEGLEKWVQLENERKQQGKELQQLSKKNMNSIKKWCDQKSELLRSEKATENLATLLNDEFMARKNNSGHVPQSYEAILQEQQKETERAIPGKDRKSRLDILKQALSADYKHEEILAVVRTKISDMDMYEDGALEKPTPFQQVDNRIKEAMRKIAKSIGLKIVRVDAKIMRAYKKNEKLAAELTNFSGADYRTIVLPLVKLCILANLKKQANMAAGEKSEVKTEVTPETKKSVNAKGNKSMKKQKKNKQNKKGKDAKSSSDKKEQSVPPNVDTDNNPERDDMGTFDDSDLEKEDEREGRMLQENLERCQKCLDDQKKAHLAWKEGEATQQADTPGLTTTTTSSTDSGAAGGSLISNVATARDEPEVSTSNIVNGNIHKQRPTSSPGLNATTTSSSHSGAAAGSSISSVPIARDEAEVSTSNIVNYNIIQSLKEDSIKKPDSEMLLRYWKSMSVDNKKNLLKLKKEELFVHCTSKQTKRVLSEAFAFYEANKSWTFRGCFCCDKKFVNAEGHLRHTIKEHVGIFLLQQDSYLPTELDSGWDSVVKEYIWPGFDASAALTILEYKLEPQPSFEEHFRVDVDRMQCAINYLSTEGCPKSNEAHTFALENVQTVLKSLLKDEFLAAEHLKMVTKYSMDRLEVLYPDSQLWELGLHHTHLCICFLGLSELKEILKFLEEISKISDITETSKIPKAKGPQIDIKEMIQLDGKLICLLLDEQFISSSDDSVTPNEDAIFNSIFPGSSSEEVLDKWVQLENDRKQQGKELQHILKENVNTMKKWCDQKSDLLRSKKATEDLALLLNSEFMARKNNREHVPQSYKEILQKQQQESEEVIPAKDRMSKLDILEQALSTDYKHEEILAVVRTKISGMEMYADGALEKPTSFQQEDIRIKEVLQRIAKSIGLKILKADATIMRAFKENQKLEPKLDNFCGADYRTILLPLVKSCILAKLEKEANMAAEEKTEVATETKKSVPKKGNQNKKQQKSAKNKQNKKGKDAKSSFDKKEQSVPLNVDTDNNSERGDMSTLDDADLENEEGREERMLQENRERSQKCLDDQNKTRLSQKERVAVQQVDTPPVLTAISTDSAAAAGSCEADISTSNIVNDNISQQPPASTIVSLHGASQSEAPRFIAARWDAAMQAYNDPSTEPSERPVMHPPQHGLEPPVPVYPDFLAALQQKVRDFKANREAEEKIIDDFLAIVEGGN